MAWSKTSESVLSAVSVRMTECIIVSEAVQQAPAGPLFTSLTSQTHSRCAPGLMHSFGGSEMEKYPMLPQAEHFGLFVQTSSLIHSSTH